MRVDVDLTWLVIQLGFSFQRNLAVGRSASLELVELQSSAAVRTITLGLRLEPLEASVV